MASNKTVHDLAQQMVDKLNDNVADYYDDKIDVSTFRARQRVMWGQINESDELGDEVYRLLLLSEEA